MLEKNIDLLDLLDSLGTFESLKNLDQKYSNSFLSIDGFYLPVKIGFSSEERVQPQEIRIDLKIKFIKTPLAVLNDNLVDTICYEEICEAFRTHTRVREYQMIEKLSRELLDLTKSIIGNRGHAILKLRKLRPPIEDLRGGVSFEIGTYS